MKESHLGYPFTLKGELKWDLRKTQQYLAKAAKTRKKSDIEDARAYNERLVLLSAFIIRKLMDAAELSKPVQKLKLKVMKFPRKANSKKPDITSQEKLMEFYDLKKSTEQNIGLRSMCNMIVHSYFWLDCISGKNIGEITGFMINCADPKFKMNGYPNKPPTSNTDHIYYVAIDEYYRVIEAAADDGFDKPMEFPNLKTRGSSSGK